MHATNPYRKDVHPTQNEDDEELPDQDDSDVHVDKELDHLTLLNSILQQISLIFETIVKPTAKGIVTSTCALTLTPV